MSAKSYEKHTIKFYYDGYTLDNKKPFTPAKDVEPKYLGKIPVHQSSTQLKKGTILSEVQGLAARKLNVEGFIIAPFAFYINRTGSDSGVYERLIEESKTVVTIHENDTVHVLHIGKPPVATPPSSNASSPAGSKKSRSPNAGEKRGRATTSSGSSSRASSTASKSSSRASSAKPADKKDKKPAEKKTKK